MSLTLYIILTFVLIGAEWIYIRLARSYGWFDLPNARSAHTNSTTVRAGGVVFYLAVVGAIWIGKLNLPYFALGLTAIAVVSFWDDLRPLPKRYRLVVHTLAVGLLLIQGNLFGSQWYIITALFLVGVGIVNAYNFMDGVNGMIALYSLVTVGTLWYCQAQTLPGAASLFPGVCISLLIFSFTNVRKQAICFAGDIGSISMGFIVLYGLLAAINRSQTYLPILFLAIYGVDSIGTILHRLYVGQPIFHAHKMHLFQLLVHQHGWPHLRVAALYAFAQAGINVLVILALDWSTLNQLALAGLILSALIVGYVWVKFRLVSAPKRVGFYVWRL
ncbi:MraY family glycosyltransferase [Spirosoma pollinicola]|uniref:UDP-GlcNAc--UDP-phosphate GlcNAc-1-phosphate transferase n=1 Tax=Spirosoma pollinicola TaxID=2057025 RepID=A0A2K8Z6P8_9BACT|nr:hypothetical protein [Spirosoma pollinicola]AUD05540.1 hypothetical protein CWM47_29060 [Spirosoma pollinicola]